MINPPGLLIQLSWEPIGIPMKACACLTLLNSKGQTFATEAFPARSGIEGSPRWNNGRAEPQQAAANKSSSPSQALKSVTWALLKSYHKIHSDPSRWNTLILFLSHSLRTLHFFLRCSQCTAKIDSRGLRLSCLNSVRQLQVLCISIRPSFHANDWVKCLVRDLPLCGRSTIRSTASK